MAIDIRKIGDVMDEYFENRSVYKCWNAVLANGGYIWIRKEDVAYIDFFPAGETTEEGHRVVVAVPLAHLKQPLNAENQFIVIGAIHYVEQSEGSESP